MPGPSFNFPTSLKNCLAEGLTFIQANAIYRRPPSLRDPIFHHNGRHPGRWGVDTCVRGGPQAYGNLEANVLSCSATYDQRVRRAFGAFAAVSGGVRANAWDCSPRVRPTVRSMMLLGRCPRLRRTFWTGRPPQPLAIRGVLVSYNGMKPPPLGEWPERKLMTLGRVHIHGHGETEGLS